MSPYAMLRNGFEIILKFSTIVQLLNSITSYITCLPAFLLSALLRNNNCLAGLYRRKIIN